MSGKSIAAIVVVAAVAVGGFFGYRYYQQQQGHEKAEKFLHSKSMASFGAATYKSASVGADGAVILKGVSITPTGAPKAYEVDELVVHRYDYDNAKPLFMHVEAKGVHMDVSSIPNPGAQLFLGLMGYKDLTADMEVNYDYKPDAKSLNLAVRETVKDLGEFKVNADLANITKPATPAAMPNTPPTMPASPLAMPDAQIKAVEVSYRDDSFISRVLKMAAAQQGVSEDQVVDRIEQQIDARLGQSKTKLQTEVLNHVKDFLKKRGTLAISVKPDQPVAVSELRGMTPDAVFDRLNIKVTSD